MPPTKGDKDIMKMNGAAGKGDRLLLGKRWPSGLDLIYSEQIGPNINTYFSCIR